MSSPSEIIDFWRDAGPQKWFARDANFDAAIRQRFEEDHHAAARCEFDDWRHTPEGALALILLLDQFPRNLWRGSAHAFATDRLALSIAEQAMAMGHHREIEMPLRLFFYMPLEHAEDLDCQQRCVDLVRAVDSGEYLKYAEVHRDIIERFGRFPHRNAVLGRITRPDEQAFLDEGGFSG